MDNSPKLGLILKKWRKEKNIKQKDFAEKIGISPSRLSRIETNNEYLSPKIINLINENYKDLLQGQLIQNHLFQLNIVSSENLTREQFSDQLFGSDDPILLMGLRLKKFRKIQGKTQEQFAKDLGYNTTYICRVEIGRDKLSSQLMDKLTKYYNISEEEFRKISVYSHDTLPSSSSASKMIKIRQFSAIVTPSFDLNRQQVSEARNQISRFSIDCIKEAKKHRFELAKEGLIEKYNENIKNEVVNNDLKPDYIWNPSQIVLFSELENYLKQLFEGWCDRLEILRDEQDFHIQLNLEDLQIVVDQK